MQKTEYPNKIVFYDGDCGFCNWIVGFILKYEKKPTTHFAALQSETAREIIENHLQKKIDLSTFYYFSNQRISCKSKGFFELAKDLKYPIRAFRFFRFLPTVWTDSLYDKIAKYRKKIMGEKCYLPTAEERKRFLR